MPFWAVTNTGMSKSLHFRLEVVEIAVAHTRLAVSSEERRAKLAITMMNDE